VTPNGLGKPSLPAQSVKSAMFPDRERSVHAYQEFVQKEFEIQPVIVCRNIMNGGVGPRRSKHRCRVAGSAKTPPSGVIARCSGCI